MCRDYWGLSRALFCGASEHDIADSTALRHPQLLSFPSSSLHQLITAAPGGWAAWLLPCPPAALGCQGNLQERGCSGAAVILLPGSAARPAAVDWEASCALSWERTRAAGAAGGSLELPCPKKRSSKSFVAFSALKCTEWAWVYFCSRTFFSMSGDMREDKNRPCFSPHYLSFISKQKSLNMLARASITGTFLFNYVYILL